MNSIYVLFYKIKLVIPGILIGFFLIGCGDSGKSQIVKLDKKDSVNFTLQTFQNPDSSYGYDIYRNSVKMIHQPHIPVLQGNRGFVSEMDAKRVGDLVIRKLNKGEIPPTIDSAEIVTIIK